MGGGGGQGGIAACSLTYSSHMRGTNGSPSLSDTCSHRVHASVRCRNLKNLDIGALPGSSCVSRSTAWLTTKAEEPPPPPPAHPPSRVHKVGHMEEHTKHRTAH